MVTVDQFRAAHAVMKRRSYRLLATLGLPFAVAIVGAAAIGLYADPIAQWYLGGDGTVRGFGLIGLLAVAAVISIVLLPTAALMFSFYRANRRDRCLVCPHCHKLLGGITDLTGNCHHCGRCALADFDIASTTGARLLTIAEFRAGVAAGRKRTLLWTGCIFSAVFLYFALLAVLAPVISQPLLAWLTPYFGHQGAKDVMCLFFLPLFLILFGGFGLYYLRDRSSPRDPRVTCPQCRASLEGNPYFVIATRRCGKCKTAIMAEPDTPLSEDEQQRPTLTPAALSAASSSCFRQIILLLLLGCAVPLVGIALFFNAAKNSLENHLGTTGDAFAIGVSVLIVIVSAVLLCLADRYFHRKQRLDCPHCGKSLMTATRLVVATGNCAHCGKCVLIESGT